MVANNDAVSLRLFELCIISRNLYFRLTNASAITNNINIDERTHLHTGGAYYCLRVGTCTKKQLQCKTNTKRNIGGSGG